MSIKHFEDLPFAEIKSVIDDISQYRITEKLDGAQLLFGLDDLGFYTTRSFKGDKRYYSHLKYEVEFHTTYRRAAHLALEQSIHKLLAAGMVPGDQVEIEVLHGEVPNVVPYSKNTNYIIFLRTTEGNVNIDRLAQEFRDHSLTLSLLTPFTHDGLGVAFKEVESTWEFYSVPEVTIDIDAFNKDIDYSRESFAKTLSWKAETIDLTWLEISTLNLSKIPVSQRPAVKEERESIIDNTRKYAARGLKETLLEHTVRNTKSKFGSADGWIEGVVLTHKVTGKMLKIVDKEVFGKAHRFIWKVRGELDGLEPSREEIVRLVDKYNKEKPHFKLRIEEIDKDFSYTGEVDKRTLEFFAYKFSRASP